MKLLPLPKASLLRKSWEYNKVYRQGRRLRGRDFSVIYVPNGRAESRLGISVHGVKRAVRRNRIKRIIREFYRLNRTFIDSAVDVIFAVRQGFMLDCPEDVGRAVQSLVEKNGNTMQPRRRIG